MMVSGIQYGPLGLHFPLLVRYLLFWICRWSRNLLDNIQRTLSSNDNVTHTFHDKKFLAPPNMYSNLRMANVIVKIYCKNSLI
jgi:hypothetical protein